MMTPRIRERDPRRPHARMRLLPRGVDTGEQDRRAALVGEIPAGVQEPVEVGARAGSGADRARLDVAGAAPRTVGIRIALNAPLDAPVNLYGVAGILIR